MNDISVGVPVYGGYAVSAVRPERGEGVQNAAARQGAASTAPSSAISAASASEAQNGGKEDKKRDKLDAFEKLISQYMPKERPNTRLQIEHDKDTGLFIYRAVDTDSGEVVRQYPADEVLRFISYHRKNEGLLVDDRA